MHKFIFILLYFDEKIKCISATRIAIYVQTCDPIFLVDLTNSTELDSNLCNYFAFFGINPLCGHGRVEKCTLYGKEVTLTPIEFSILWYLCENRGKVISSEELFENIWGEKFLDNNNTVMAHIGRLREKLNEPAKKPKFIKTVWGVGYTIEK